MNILYAKKKNYNYNKKQLDFMLSKKDLINAIEDHCYLGVVKTDTIEEVSSKQTETISIDDSLTTTWLCKYCDFICDTEQLLNSHLVFHYHDEKVQCEVCGYVNIPTVLFQSHMERHQSGTATPNLVAQEKPTTFVPLSSKSSINRKKYHLCDVCGFKCFVLKTLELHKAKFHNHETIKRSFGCVTCDFKCYSKLMLRQHKRIHGDKVIITQCDTCGLKFKNNFLLKCHIRRHTGEKPFSCNICGSKFRLRKGLTMHVKTHTGEKSHQCDVCGRRFTNSGNLNRHKLNHTGIRPFSCDICQRSFVQKTQLRAHALLHSSIRPFECNICKNKFKSKALLKQHSLIHFKFKNGSRYKRIKATISTKLQLPKLKCQFCKYETTSEVDLIVHSKLHNDKQLKLNYECKVCDYKSPSKAAFSLHTKIHSDVKPFKCEFCDYKTQFKGKLKGHERVHTGEKPWRCNVCPFSTAHASSLRKHTKMHNGEKPYNCKICNYKCTRKAYLLRHLLQHAV